MYRGSGQISILASLLSPQSIVGVPLMYLAHRGQVIPCQALYATHRNAHAFHDHNGQ